MGEALIFTALLLAAGIAIGVVLAIVYIGRREIAALEAEAEASADAELARSLAKEEDSWLR